MIMNILIKTVLYHNKAQHPSNSVILGATGCSKTNLLFNILTLNPVYNKIFIITKEAEYKYSFLISKFPNDIKIFYQNDKYDLDKLINGKKQVCYIFDDLIKDNNYINEWFVRSRKKNCSNFFYLIHILKYLKH